MKGRAIIFGAGGQDGFYLQKYLKESGFEVFSFTHKSGDPAFRLDVSDFKNVSRVISKIRPNYIFHLAAVSSTQHKFIFENQAAIVNGALSILEAADSLVPESKIFIASSGLIFKNIGAPISEKDEFSVSSAYALARIEALKIARYYRQRGRKVYIGYLFNHESPRRPRNSVARQIAGQVADIFLGLGTHISIGNMQVIKEWTWAGDIVSAIMLFVNQDDFFEVCIGDGIGKSIAEYATTCCEVCNISLNDHLTSLDNFYSEYSFLVCDSNKIRSIGWAPSLDLKGLSKQMISFEIASRENSYK